ncbi:MAG: hypothetical protein LBK40_02940 [Spirochaetaceae bacterium]|jgi:fumarate reductase flavoprotein subunit|nr:hypothetical protein [Spirochaetaceae bacterium]
MIFDRSIIDSVRDVREYYELGLYESAPTLEALADKIGVNRTNLLKTIEDYRGCPKT